MATNNPAPKKDRTVNPVVIGIVAIIVVLLVLTAVLAGSLAVSASRAHGLITNASEAYTEARASLEDGNFEKAYASARSAAESMSALPKELEGPQWSIATALPILGTDARAAREMASIAGDLADEAVLPVFDQWDYVTKTLVETDGIQDAGRVVSFLGEELPKFGENLVHAKQVVYECEERANNLPETHFSELNDAASEIKDAMTTTGDMLRTFDRAVDEFDPKTFIGEALTRIDLKSLLEKVGLSGLLGKIA